MDEINETGLDEQIEEGTVMMIRLPCDANRLSRMLRLAVREWGEDLQLAPRFLDASTWIQLTIPPITPTPE